MSPLPITHYWAACTQSLHHLALDLATAWAWLFAVFTHSPTYMTAKGQHIIRNQLPGHIYITRVPHSNPLFVRNSLPNQRRHWRAEREVVEVVQKTEFVLCPDERDDWVVVGPKATQGCYIEGGGFNHYIIKEVGTYLDERAPIRPGPDRE